LSPRTSTFAHRIVGGTYTASDKSGDARVFTQKPASLCEQRGLQMLFGHSIERLDKVGDAIKSAAVCALNTRVRCQLHADAVVVACGSYAAPLLRSVGVDIPVYPGKGYSATPPLLRPEAAPQISTIGDEK
jgi:D-amino-acid dehydrogenase